MSLERLGAMNQKSHTWCDTATAQIDTILPGNWLPPAALSDNFVAIRICTYLIPDKPNPKPGQTKLGCIPLPKTNQNIAGIQM